MRYVALLRAINVGGHVVKMDRLRTLFEELKFKNVETFIASGNVIFETTSNNAAELETKIEKHLKKALGYEVGVFLRTCAEIAAIAEYAPFTSKDGCLVHVAFLKAPPDNAAKQKVLALKTKDDDFHTHKREWYWQTRGSFGKSPAAVPFGKIAGSAGTMRNVTTVRKLAAKYKA